MRCIDQVIAPSPPPVIEHQALRLGYGHLKVAKSNSGAAASLSRVKSTADETTEPDGPVQNDKTAWEIIHFQLFSMRSWDEFRVVRKNLPTG